MKKMTKYLLLLVLINFSLQAQLFYSSAKYNKVYNQKIALELELESLKSQFKNEKENLAKEINSLKLKIQDLEKQLENEKKFRESDNNTNKDKIADLEKNIEILKQSSTDKEKQLLEESAKQRDKYLKQIEDLKAELEKEKKDRAEKEAELKKQYEDKIAGLESQISSLSEEINLLKKLNESQKKELSRLSEQTSALENKLKGEIAKGDIRLKKYHNRLIINIDDKISFDSGSAELKEAIKPAINKIAEILADYPENEIFIEGHTDNIPIKTKRFPDNWELSTARALEVLRFIINNKKTDPNKYSVAGFGEYKPIVANDTPENRSLNRRVDIVIIPKATGSSSDSETSTDSETKSN